MKGVLMAGGFGTRIQPLTHSLPKPMVPLLNRPMMEHIVVRLRNAGITEIVVLLYYMPEVIREYFGDGSRFGVELPYVLPDDDYGTAGAVKCAEQAIWTPPSWCVPATWSPTSTSGGSWSSTAPRSRR